jgi:hypothetical protein
MFSNIIMNSREKNFLSQYLYSIYRVLSFKLSEHFAVLKNCFYDIKKHVILRPVIFLLPLWVIKMNGL